MNIRMLQEPELLPALHLVWDVFAKEIAPLYTPEGVAEFQQFIKYENILPGYQKREMVFFGSFDDRNQLSGVIAVRVPENENISGNSTYGTEGTYGEKPVRKAHISLFFVRKDMQGQGVGRALYQTVYNFSAQQLRANRLTVNASTISAEKYAHLGMNQTGPAQTVNGICSVPMECMVIPGLVQPVEKKKKRAVWIIVTVVILALLFGILAFGAYQFGKWVSSEANSYIEPGLEFGPDSGFDFGEGSGDEGGFGFGNGAGSDNIYNDGSSDDSLNGLDGIPEYQSEDISYKLEDQEYTYEDESKTSTLIKFDVKYPEVTGLADADVQKKVNESLKNVAMDTVDKIYTNPSDEIKEAVLGAKQPALVSFVQYKVCYSSEGLLSVVYEDYSYRGNSEVMQQNLRSCNISLKDGTVYQVKDIININDEFVDEWLKTMRSEADDEDFLSELSKDQMKEALNGDDQDGVYVTNFFLDKDGIEIGFDLNYKENDENNSSYVWVTAPFSYDEIEKYQKGQDFWSLK